MTEAPSFSSFPELEEASNSQAGPSKQPAPSFESFPELSSRKRREGSWERRPPGDEEKRRSKHRKSERHRSDRSKSRNERESEDEGTMRRQRKEKRRRKEREKAEQLKRGENLLSDPNREERSGSKVIGDGDDGIPWYEKSNKKGPARGVYEEPLDPTSSKTFFPDTVGDRDAIRYGSSSSLSAPRYYRDGQGKILGVNDGLRLVHSKDRTEKGLELAPKGRPYIPRYSTRPLEGSRSLHLSRLLMRPTTEDDFDAETPFITFNVDQKRRVDDDEEPDYRDIRQTARQEDEDDEAVVEVGLENCATLEQDVRRQTAEIEWHLRTHPDDVDTWITYSTLHLKLSPSRANSTANAAVDPLKLPQNRASVEVTLSIIARALDAHPANFVSTSLHTAYLKAAEMFWPSHKVTSRWKNVLRELGDRLQTGDAKDFEEQMMAIWLGYIEWREGKGFGQSSEQKQNVGGVDEVIDVYIECLETLNMGRMLEGNQQAREENQVYLFLRACLFMKQAGFAERALACFQALMEITFLKPDHLRPPAQVSSAWFERVIQEFEEFWDTETTRIGEAGAKGWRNSSSADMPLNRQVPDLSHSSSDPFEKWLEAEHHATTRNNLPGRATDLNAEDDEDPYRVTLFSDIQPFLFPVRSPEVRLQLVYAYFHFLGLPFTPPDVPSSSPSATDPHLRSALAYNETGRAAFWPPRSGQRRIPWQTVGGEPMDPESARPLQTPFSCPVKCWASERSSLFTRSSKWFHDLDASELQHVDMEVVRNSFALLRPLIPDPAFTLAFFAFEAAVSPKSAVKASKAILSADRDNYVLWDGYARLERRRGNVAAARAVYATAIKAAKASLADEDEIELWASWAEMEFEENDEARCLEVLFMASGLPIDKIDLVVAPTYAPTPPSTIFMLKVNQYYSSIDLPVAPSRLCLMILFTYLVHGVDQVRDLTVRQISKVPPHGYEAEEAHQLLCKLLYHHASRHASPASLARTALESAIQSFPNNTMFLSLYLWGEMGGRVYGRVQRLVADLSISEKAGVVGHLWAVWAEANSAHRTFWDAGGGGAERVRVALDRAINSDSGKRCVPLWKLYIEFETHMGQYNDAKKLCYRALAALGGCKDLYLLPYTAALRPHFTIRELCDLSELITERGIRIRVPFEQFFDPSGGDEPALALPEDEELMEDELEFLLERETLKPY